MHAVEPTPREYRVEIVDRRHPERPALEQQIAARYRRAFDARLHYFMPQLVPLWDSHQQLLALAGFQGAAQGALFLEQYLDAPIQALLSMRNETTVAREDIVEIGQLAAFQPGVAPVHFVALARLLAASGFRWASFTATGPLHLMLKRLGLRPMRLAFADARRVADPTSWGSYYDTQPRVLAIPVQEGLARLRPIESQIHIPALLRGCP